MSKEIGPCGRRCALLAEAEARACEFEAQCLREIEHEAAKVDEPKAEPDEPKRRSLGGIGVYS